MALSVLVVLVGGAIWTWQTLGAPMLGSGGFQHLFWRKGSLNHPLNVLLIGQQSAGKAARGDLFMVARIDPRLDQLTVLSLPARTQTTIPGFGTGTLAQAPVIGGIDLARKTVETILGIPLDRVVALTPRAEAAIVDAAGGIQVEVPSIRHLLDPVSKQPLVLAAGLQRLDGSAVSSYASAPAPPGSLSRVRQQQYVMFGLASQLANHAGNIPKVRQAFLGSAAGNLRPQDVQNLVRFLSSRPFLEFATLPGNAGFDNTWIPNPLRLKSLLKRISTPAAMQGAKSSMVEILFSPLQEKAASKLANELTDRGLTVVRTAPLPDEEASCVVSRKTSGRLDNVVRQIAPSAPWFLSDDPSPYSADYTLRIGATPL